MLNFEYHIKSLLYTHKCVIIPGFGGFITRESPASLHNETGILKPFTRTIFFNGNLTENDGLLADALSKSLQTTYDNALQMIERKTSEMQLELQNTKKLALGELGTFYLNSEGKIWFNANLKLNFCLTTYGLDPIVAQKVSTISNKQSLDFPHAKHLINFTGEKPLQSFTKRRYIGLKIAASVLIFLTLGALSYQFKDKFYGNGGMYEGGMPFSTAPIVIDNIEHEKTTVLEPEQTETTLETTPNIPIETNATNVVSPDIENIVAEHPTSIYPSIESGVSYHVVLASFLIESNAEQFITDKEASGINTFKLMTPGSRLIKVSCGDFATMDEAKTHLNTLPQETAAKAWIIELKNIQ